MATVLIVDDEKSVRTTLRSFLEQAGHKVFDAVGIKDANECVNRQPLDVALLDILLEAGSGLDVARHLRDRQPAVPSILMTAEPNFASASDATRLRVFDYLVKPFDRRHLLGIVAEAAASKARESDYALLLREREQFGEEMERQVKERTAELVQGEANLHALAARLQNIREAERKALARELHDEFGQNLTALQIDVEWLTQRLRTVDPGDVAQVQSRLVAMSPLAQRLTEMTQTVCASLRPGMLDDLGLAAAIEWQAAEFEKRTGLTCVVSLPADDAALPPDHALALFRIAQEAMTNVARHARATRVEVKLHSCNGDVHLTVQDNGKGFAPESLSVPQALGLLSMRERAMGFRGSVNIVSEVGKGTTLLVRMPRNGKVTV